MKILAIVVFGLGFSCLLCTTLGEVSRYKIAIEERGTLFTEEIEVDEQSNVEVIRVPAHNDVKATDFLHDFNVRVTVTKSLSRQVCYISEMVSSLSYPGKLKADIQRAASQAGKLLVETKSSVVMVTGPANRRLLTGKILDFCGSLPIYNTELIKADLSNEHGSAIIRDQAIRLRRQAPSTTIRRFNRTCISMETATPSPNQNGQTVQPDPFEKVKNCLVKDHWDISCRMKDLNCFYFVTCEYRSLPVKDWHCSETHEYSAIPACCDYICHEQDEQENS